MAVHPLRLLEYNLKYRNREIIDATISNLELLGTGLWVGFSFTWMAELYAVQGNGEGAAYQLKLFWENLCSPNGFHLNGDYKKRGVTSMHYRPFTLESNMCAADALQEMLLKTDRNIIRVFPAIPEEWKRKGASFDSLRGWKGILVSSEIKDEKLVYIKLTASKDGEYRIYNGFSSENIIVQFADRNVIIECEKGGIFKVAMKNGEGCTIFGG
jgi:alpha-L-fucosidase 2